MLDGAPSLAALYAKAMLPVMPGLRLLPRLGGPPLATPPASSDAVPQVRLELHGLRVDTAQLEAYRDVTSFPLRSALPATYLHVVAFPLHLRLMTDPGFPFPAMGTVHIGNRIEHRRPLDLGQPFDVRVWCERLQPHPKGRTVTVTSEALVGDAVVWRAETVLLSRGRPPAEPRPPAAEPADLPESAPTGSTRCELHGDLGRRYAAVSGDRNPIHLYDVTARLFGFRRHIAHGMWTKARCLAALENRLPDRYSVDVAFKKPVELPATVAFGARDSGNRLDFGVTAPGSGAPHLVGRVTRA